jgi:hypothetical protein
MPGARGPALEGDALLKPPAKLEAPVRAAWRRLAPRALAERTLTAATAPGFEQLCRQWVYVAELEATIARLGAGTREADAYLRQYTRLATRLDGSLGRFKLTAAGQAATAPAPAAVANPWAVVARGPGN